MKFGLRVGIVLIMGVLAGIPAAAQQVDALIDALVSNGTLTSEQADRVRAKLDQEYAQTSAGKIELAKSVQKLQFYGDGRLRYENIDQNNHYHNGITLTDRERYRLRLGADYTFSDHFKAGFELESGTVDDSANQTFGGTFTKASLNVGKIFLRYDPTDWLTAYAGKFSNPWYTTTDIVYSFDLNPEGGAEIATFHPLDNLTVGLTAVQYLYVNANEADTAATAGINRNDVQIIGEQVPITWKITDDVTFKVAPGFTFYTGGGNNNYDSGVPANNSAGAATVPGTAGASQTETFVPGTANSGVDPVFVSSREADDLNILSAPGEFNFNIAGVPVRPYWDFEWNTSGRERIRNVYLNQTGLGGTAAAANTIIRKNAALNDDVAWGAGVQVGVNKKKGDFSALGEFRQIGLGAVDQNINGTDYGDSYANQQGLKFAAAYNLTDSILATLTFYDTWDYKAGLYDSLGGIKTGAPTTGTTTSLIAAKGLQRVQVDLGWKF